MISLGFTASTLTNPIWLIKTRLQLDRSSGTKSLNIRSCVANIYNDLVSHTVWKKRLQSSPKKSHWTNFSARKLLSFWFSSGCIFWQIQKKNLVKSWKEHGFTIGFWEWPFSDLKIFSQFWTWIIQKLWLCYKILFFGMGTIFAKPTLKKTNPLWQITFLHVSLYYMYSSSISCLLISNNFICFSGK